MCSLQDQGRHFQALVPSIEVPQLVAACCRCKNMCMCDPANHLHYNLSIGCGPSHQRFLRQHKAIEAELLLPRQQRALADMPYHVRTVPTKANYPAPIETRLGPSKLSSGACGEVLLGVFPHHGQPAVAATPLPGGEAQRRARSVTTDTSGGAPHLPPTILLHACEISIA